eukprot:CAMPEP_0195096504 /NCGR_PEP_ID=MMETSP0448-20130528/51591_1 /TAXON_ID=66468 /ORGANISM="Heterocapsa triquestra, Strain CCMP 448" /LENGTH=33 /DNA_ID= /DNA_START= /DNA_END= /DNA_ORIENTATION=
MGLCLQARAREAVHAQMTDAVQQGTIRPRGSHP